MVVCFGCERNEDNRRQLSTIIIIERSVAIQNIYIDITRTINRVTIAQITIRPNTVRPGGSKGKRYDIQETHPTNTPYHRNRVTGLIHTDVINS